VKKIICVIFVLLFFAPFAQAEINGKKVVYIHGLQILAFTAAVDDNRAATLREDAQGQAGEFLRSRFDDFIYYDSAQRLSANSLSLYNQVKRIESEGTCRDGCYFMTASTGDLVARYIMTRLNQWDVDRDDFRVLLSIDLVGAGGGTELANTAVSVIEGNSVTTAIINYLTDIFFGFELTSGSTVGIVNDLRPSIARGTATQATAVPRLRVVGGQTTPIVSALLKGGDDGTVPMHSSCGSARVESIKSCSRSIKLNGRVTSADGPRTLRYNHFPIIMGEEMSHTETDHIGTLVAVNNGVNFGEFRYDAQETTETTGWWLFKKTFRTIDKPSSLPTVEFLVDSIEN